MSVHRGAELLSDSPELLKVFGFTAGLLQLYTVFYWTDVDLVQIKQ